MSDAEIPPTTARPHPSADPTTSDAAPRPIRLLLVDDQPLVRMGNALLLEAAGGIEVVAEAGDGREAVALAGQLRPDVVLMDVRMPGMDGIAATAEITRRLPTTRILVLTTFDLDEYAFGALDAGASAFLLKTATPEQLVDAVRVVAAGESVVAPRITAQLIRHYTQRSTQTGGRHAAARLATLTPREHVVFLALAGGLSNPEIARELHLSPSSIKTYVNRIFAKLAVRDRVQAVILGYEAGVVPPRA